MYLLFSSLCTNTAQSARVCCVNRQWPTSALSWAAHSGFLFAEIQAWRTSNGSWDFTSICAQDPAVLLFSLFLGSTVLQAQQEGQNGAAQFSLSSSLERANVNLSTCVPSSFPQQKESVGTGAMVPFPPQGIQPTSASRWDLHPPGGSRLWIWGKWFLQPHLG